MDLRQSAMQALLALLAVLLILRPDTRIDAQETTYRMSDYLPMVVGNSWTYYHRFFDFRLREDGSGPLNPWNYPDHEAARGAFTITILRTEVIDGNTYHVFSDMPSGGWPPATPYFCLLYTSPSPRDGLLSRMPSSA